MTKNKIYTPCTPIPFYIKYTDYVDPITKLRLIKCHKNTCLISIYFFFFTSLDHSPTWSSNVLKFFRQVFPEYPPVSAGFGTPWGKLLLPSMISCDGTAMFGNGKGASPPEALKFVFFSFNLKDLMNVQILNYYMYVIQCIKTEGILVANNKGAYISIFVLKMGKQ